MAKKGSLFFLIQSLSKSEKRYFKIFCFGQKGDSLQNRNYLQLFEAIEQQEQYDEAAIRQQFAGATFLQQLHVTKNYLYQLLLKSLRNYHSKSSPLATVHHLLHNIELLFDRELYDHCHYEIQKAERLAAKKELLTAQIEIADWKRRLHLARHNRQPAALNTFNEAENHAIQQLAQINRYWHYSANIFDYHNDEQQRLLQDDLFTQTALPQNLQALVLHQHVLYTYFIINRQPQKAYSHLLAQIQYLEEQPQRRAAHPSLYLSALNNQVSFLIRQGDFDQAIPILSQIRDFAQQQVPRNKRKRQKLTVRTLLRSYNMELEVYRDTRNTEKGLRLIEEIRAFVKAHSQSIPEEYNLMLWYQFAHLYLLQGDHYQALHWTNAIINTRFTSGRKDLQGFARFLNLIIHFELGNTMVLRYSVDQCRRFLKKNKKMEAYEQALLQFFSKASRSPKTKIRSLRQQLYQQLFAAEAPLVNDNILDYFDFKEWLERKF